MAHAALAGAAAASTFGATQATWQYNRENYMWDKQNRQNYVFQLQNMLVSQYSIYREDIRDLFALTNNKMSSYLVVGTLMIGFIVTVFWNFNRTNPIDPEQEMGHRLPGYHQLEALFTMHMMTAFSFLLTCIWFAIQTLIVSQSYMTKILVHTVRVPIPENEAIARACPEASEFETEARAAFRIPFLDKFRKPCKEGLQEGPQEGLQERRRSSLMLPKRRASTGSSFSSGRSEQLPHIRLYQELKHNWVPYDFYCQASLSIGTSTLLKGLSYYVLYYQNGVNLLFAHDSLISDAMYGKHHSPFGAFAFVFLSLLTLWMTVGSIDLPWLPFTLLTSSLSASPAIVVLLFVTNSKMTFGEYLTILLSNAFAVFMLLYLTLAMDENNISGYWASARFLGIFEEHMHEPGAGGAKEGSGKLAMSDAGTSDEDDLEAVGRSPSATWLDDLASYGGQRIESLRSYEDQFITPGHHQSPARWQFKGLSALTLLMWALVIPYEAMDEYGAADIISHSNMTSLPK